MGILIYRVIFGKYPFSKGYKTLQEVFKDIFFTDVQIRNDLIITSQIFNKLLTNLLNKEFENRLGIHDNMFDH